MTTIQQQISLQAPVEKVYAFLSNGNNHEKLMPPTITGWQSTEDTAQFSIQGLAKLSLKVTERIENQKIAFGPVDKPPFDFSLYWDLQKGQDTQTLANLRIDADLNMMLKMMVSGPLQKLVDYQVAQLAVAVE